MINIEQLKQEVSEVTHEFDRKVAMQVIDYLSEKGYLGVVQDGYVLVPKEPTPHMIEQSNLGVTIRDKYRFMIDAAPKPPKGE